MKYNLKPLLLHIHCYTRNIPTEFYITLKHSWLYKTDAKWKININKCTGSSTEQY